MSFESECYARETLRIHARAQREKEILIGLQTHESIKIGELLYIWNSNPDSDQEWKALANKLYEITGMHISMDTLEHLLGAYRFSLGLDE